MKKLAVGSWNHLHRDFCKALANSAVVPGECGCGLEPFAQQVRRTARADALREAAEVAESMNPDPGQHPEGDYYCNRHGERIGAALRQRAEAEERGEEPDAD